MREIISALESFFDTIGSIIEFVIDFIGDLVTFVEMLGNYLADLPSYFSFLPSAVVGSIVAIFSIVVLFKILGRN